MKHSTLAVLLGLSLSTAALAAPAYPPAPRSATVDDYNGVKVSDPYRPLEDPDSAVTRRWVQAETQRTNAFLSRIPQRAAIHQRLEALWNYERVNAPDKEGGHYFYYRQAGLQPQKALWVRDTLTAEPRLLLDPNNLSADHTTSIGEIAIARDGHRLAWGTSEKGSDWQVWKVRNVDTGTDLTDELHWLKFTRPAWQPDGTGFYYGRYPTPTGDKSMTAVNEGQSIYFHRLGEAQDRDRLIFEDKPHPNRIFDVQTTDDGHYLVFTVEDGTDTRTGISILDLTQPDATVRELLPPLKSAYTVVGTQGNTFYVMTDEGAARGKVVAIDAAQPEARKVIIPEGPDALKSVVVVHNHLIAAYLKDAHSRLAIYGMDGRQQTDVTLPGLGTITELTGHQEDDEAFLTFTGYTMPIRVYRLEPDTGHMTLFHAPRTPVDPQQYETRQVFYRSKDGTRVPMFLTAHRGRMARGPAPTLLYGYGGFDIPITPSYSASAVAWMDQGGVWAVANIRGGGEYGEDWHRAGMLTHKQTVFDDFIAAGQYLLDTRVAGRHQLGITGRSNGGLLVGAVEVQRPDLFAATVPGVGVMDMLRFNKFTIGRAWTAEYGSPEDPHMFPVLRRYSPLHNIRPGVSYPPTLVLTSDHDDRVVPAHSYKFTATLQAAQAGPAPILIRISTSTGHGAGMPVSKLIEEATDWIAFLVFELKP